MGVGKASLQRPVHKYVVTVVLQLLHAAWDCLRDWGGCHARAPALRVHKRFSVPSRMLRASRARPRYSGGGGGRLHRLCGRQDGRRSRLRRQPCLHDMVLILAVPLRFLKAKLQSSGGGSGFEIRTHISSRSNSRSESGNSSCERSSKRWRHMCKPCETNKQ